MCQLLTPSFDILVSLSFASPSKYAAATTAVFLSGTESRIEVSLSSKDY